MANEETDVMDRVGELAIDIVNDMREAAPQVTEAAVRYVWAQGVTGLVMAGVILLAALVMSFGIMPYLAKRVDKDAESWGFVAFLAASVTAVLFLVAVLTVSNNLPTVLAPEGATVMKLIAAARGG